MAVDNSSHGKADHGVAQVPRTESVMAGNYHVVVGGETHKRQSQCPTGQTYQNRDVLLSKVKGETGDCKIHLALTQGCFQKAEGDDYISILSTLSCSSFSQCIYNAIMLT